MTYHRQDSRSGPGPGALLGRLYELSVELGPRLDARESGAAPSAAGFATAVRLTNWPRAHATRKLLCTPWLALVLAGCAEARWAGASLRAQAGDVLWLPARTPLEVTYLPDATADGYQALEVEIVAEALARWLPPEPAMGGDPSSARPQIRRPGRAALGALVHFCEGILEPAAHPLVIEHQLEGFLLALALEDDRYAVMLDSARARLDPVLASRQLVRADPACGWCLGEVARKLGLSAITLRRRLSKLGTGLRRIVTEERMSIARTLLGDGRLNVSEVAVRCGYGSTAKFSRQFRHAFGVLPSHYRRAPFLYPWM